MTEDRFSYEPLVNPPGPARPVRAPQAADPRGSPACGHPRPRRARPARDQDRRHRGGRRRWSGHVLPALRHQGRALRRPGRGRRDAPQGGRGCRPRGRRAARRAEPGRDRRPVSIRARQPRGLQAGLRPHHLAPRRRPARPGALRARHRTDHPHRHAARRLRHRGSRPRRPGPGRHVHPAPGVVDGARSGAGRVARGDHHHAHPARAEPELIRKEDMPMYAAAAGPAPTHDERERQIELLSTTFNTAYAWNYEMVRRDLHNLYEKAKRDQWNATDQLPWQAAVDVEAENLPDMQIPIYGTPLWDKLTPPEVRKLRREQLRWLLSNFMHGEQGALLATAQIVDATPWMEAKFYGSTQVMDEARHVEVFSRYLNEKLGGSYRINPNLKSLI